MNGLRGFFSLILLLAALSCGTLSVMSGLQLSGSGATSSASVAARPGIERAPASRPDNPRPRRKLLQLEPSQLAAVNGRGELSGTSWANIVVLSDRIETLIGDRVTWTAPYRSLPRFDGKISLADVTRLIAKSPTPDWLRQTAPGVFLLKTGLVQDRGTRMEVVAPEVKEVRLASQPYVYMSGVNATVLFRGVKVTSWLPKENRPDADPEHRRPFVGYDKGGRLDIVNSEFSHLGTDSAKAYGVSWGDATTGQAVGSLFHHNLFGVYTGKAVNVVFRKNVVRDNAIYGFDPHSSSRGLTVVDNEAYGNNSHGIIFSDDVTDSVVERNRSYHNGGNGIMMDEKCDRNVIRNNAVWENGGDGIVIQGSSRALVTENRVTNNGVGVRVNANELGPTVGTQIVANDINDNDLGIQVYGAAKQTASRDNDVRNSIVAALVFAEPTLSDSDAVTGGQKAVVADQTEVTMRQLKVVDVELGVVVGEGSRITLEAARINARDTAVDVEAGGTVIVTALPGIAQSVVTGARKGIVVNGTAELRDVSIQEVERGVLVGPEGRAIISGTAIVASSKGVEVAGAESLTRVRLLSSDVRAPEPVVGASVGDQASNNLSAVPSWLAIAGAGFVVLALMLHFGHRVLSPMSGVRHKAIPAGSGGGDG